MSINESSCSVHSNSDEPMLESSFSIASEPELRNTVAAGPHNLNLKSPDTSASNLITQPNSESSFPKVDGLDEDKFYAAALYLHAAKGSFDGATLEHLSQTPKETREFLDHLADCFARSKSEDASSHVSATAMVRTENEITLYVAKNHSEKGRDPPVSPTDAIFFFNENKDFAEKLQICFNALAGQLNTEADSPDFDSYLSIWKTLCSFSQSRLEHYIEKINELSLEDATMFSLSINDGQYAEVLKEIWQIVLECKAYEKVKSEATDSVNEAHTHLTTCAQLAGEIRNDSGFLQFQAKVLKQKETEVLSEALIGISYLGRMFVAYLSFHDFCRHEKQRECTFKFQLLHSGEYKWNGDAYMKKAESWIGDQVISEERENRKTVKTLMSEIIHTTNKTARVHCEMQLMMHFSQTDEENCLDYFGCSKKSCWLCWQMICRNSKFSTKGTHCKIYPRWAFPYQYSSSQPTVAAGLRAAYKKMVSIIANKVKRSESASPLQPRAQSSPRRTLPYLNEGLDYSPFQTTHIEMPGRTSILTVPALHLRPGGTPDSIRHVRVNAYEMNNSNVSEILMMKQTFNDKVAVFAFQLRTKQAVTTLSEIDEVQQALWDAEICLPLDVHNSPESPKHLAYLMYYRSAEETLIPNSKISEIWNKLDFDVDDAEDGDEAGLLPWREDVFIMRISFKPLDQSFTLIEDSSEIDIPNCLDAIECTMDLGGPRYARDTRRSNFDTAFWLVRWTEAD